MKYELGYIYAIWDIENPALIYYGSTGNLCRRIAKHKSPNNNCSSKQIIARENYEYAILETHENIDEYDLHERESWYIRNKQCINIAVPHRTHAEWYEDNRDKILAGKAEYRQNNIDKILAGKAEYRQNNKDKIAEYYHKNKEKFAEYRQNNKDKIAERMAEYRQNNKEKIAEYQAEFRALKFVCECGGKYTKQHKSDHEKSQRHINYIASLNTP
jgi:hypothetical protein